MRMERMKHNRAEPDYDGTLSSHCTLSNEYHDSPLSTYSSCGWSFECLSLKFAGTRTGPDREIDLHRDAADNGIQLPRPHAQAPFASSLIFSNLRPRGTTGAPSHAVNSGKHSPFIKSDKDPSCAPSEILLPGKQIE